MPPPRPAPPVDPYAITPRPEDADDDVVYYRERAIALKSGVRGELVRTNFVRLRRGRLYLRSGMAAAEAKVLDTRLDEAFAKNDDAAVLDLSAQLLADDQAAIRVHRMRGMALRRMGRVAEADFHRDVARVLIESIVGVGDGRTFDSAWVVFRGKEEAEVLKALGCATESQNLSLRGGRKFDVLLTRKADSGEARELYFDVTELHAEALRTPGRN